MAAMSGAWLRRKVRQGWEGGPCGDLEAELEKLAMDTWGAPQWIIDAHAPDQGPQIGWSVEERPLLCCVGPRQSRFVGKLPTRDETRQIAANIAKLPELREP